MADIQDVHIDTLKLFYDNLQQFIDIFSNLYKFDATQYLIPLIMKKIKEFLDVKKEFPGCITPDFILTLEELKIMLRICSVLFQKTSLPLSMRFFIGDMDYHLNHGKKVVIMPLPTIALDNIMHGMFEHMSNNPIDDDHSNVKPFIMELFFWKNIRTQNHVGFMQHQEGTPRMHSQGGNSRMQHQEGTPRMHSQDENPKIHFQGGNSRMHFQGANPKIHFQGGNSRMHFRGGNAGIHSQNENPKIHFQGGNARMHSQGGNPKTSKVKFHVVNPKDGNSGV